MRSNAPTTRKEEQLALDLIHEVQSRPHNPEELCTEYHHLAKVYCQQGRMTEAIQHFAHVVRISEEAGIRINLIGSYQGIGNAYTKLGRPVEALQIHLRALDLAHEILPANHQVFTLLYCSIACTHQALGKLEESLQYYWKALEIADEILPANHSHFAVLYNGLGGTLRSQGRLAEAYQSHLKAITIQKEVLAANHADLAVSYSHLGNVYPDQGQLHEALQYRLKAIQIQREVLPTHSTALASSYSSISTAYCLGRLEEALQYSMAAVQILSEPGYHTQELASAYHNLAIIYHTQRRLTEAYHTHLKAASKARFSQTTIPPSRLLTTTSGRFSSSKARILRRFLIS